MRLSKKINQDIHEEHENDELWAISYGDMITLLLSFFVIYFSIDPKKNEAEKLDNHIIANFKIMDLQKIKTTTPSLINKMNPKKEDLNFEQIQNAKITKLGDRLLVTFGQMSFFDTGIIDPNKEGEIALKDFAKNFLPYSGLYKVGIKAFTDKTRVTSKQRYKDNMELSVLRALAALRILQKSGIPLNRMEIAGYGEMTQLQTLVDQEKLKKLSEVEIKNISRTLVLIIKHDNEQSVL